MTPSIQKLLDDGVLKYDGSDGDLLVFDIPALDRIQPLAKFDARVFYMLFCDEREASITMDSTAYGDEYEPVIAEGTVIWEGTPDNAAAWIREATGL